jgi:hypothetical protein
MKLRLICSGLSQLPLRAEEAGDEAGVRLPRVFLARDSQQFLPDFALLLLADEILMDRLTFEGLIRGQILSGPTVPLLARLLQQEGFIRLEDFASAGRAATNPLAARLPGDLAALETWIPAVREWLAAWQAHYEGIQLTLRPVIKEMREGVAAGKAPKLDYAQQASKFLHDTGGRFQMASFYAEESLPSATGSLNEEQRFELQTLVSEKLGFTRGNLALGQEFGAAVHDWCDLEPFYREIVTRAAKSAGDEKWESEARRLFEIPLPEFTFWHPDNVLRALNDPQVRQLREVIRESIATKKPVEPKQFKTGLSALKNLDHGIVGVRLVTANLAGAPRRPERAAKVAPSGEALLADSVLLLTSRSVDARRPKKT